MILPAALKLCILFVLQMGTLRHRVSECLFQVIQLHQGLKSR